MMSKDKTGPLSPKDFHVGQVLYGKATRDWARGDSEFEVVKVGRKYVWVKARDSKGKLYGIDQQVNFSNPHTKQMTLIGHSLYFSAAHRARTVWLGSCTGIINARLRDYFTMSDVLRNMTDEQLAQLAALIGVTLPPAPGAGEGGK